MDVCFVKREGGKEAERQNRQRGTKARRFYPLRSTLCSLPSYLFYPILMDVAPSGLLGLVASLPPYLVAFLPPCLVAYFASLPFLSKINLHIILFRPAGRISKVTIVGLVRNILDLGCLSGQTYERYVIILKIMV